MVALKSAVTKKEDHIEVLQTFSLLFRLHAVLATPSLMRIMKMAKMTKMTMTPFFQSLLLAAAPMAAELCRVALSWWRSVTHNISAHRWCPVP